VQENDLIMKPAKAFKLQEIAQHDFVISGSKEHSIAKTTSNNFIPGVERKQLRKLNSQPTKFNKVEDEEDENEGGEGGSESDPGSSRGKRKKKKRRMFNDINQSEHSKQYENSLDIDSEVCKSDDDIPKIKIDGISPGNLFKEEGTDTPIIEDIPMSVFDSSQSSNSDDTFKSYSKDELLDELNRERVHIIVEKMSDEENDSSYAGDNVTISLDDIPLEIDQGLDDKRAGGMEEMHADNGKAFRQKGQKNEREVKLYPDESVDSGGDYVIRSSTHKKSKKLQFDELKSTIPNEYEDFKNEVYAESTLKDLERQMIDSSKLD
jgi:hypothetical protein